MHRRDSLHASGLLRDARHPPTLVHGQRYGGCHLQLPGRLGRTLSRPRLCVLGERDAASPQRASPTRSLDAPPRCVPRSKVRGPSPATRRATPATSSTSRGRRAAPAAVGPPARAGSRGARSSSSCCRSRSWCTWAAGWRTTSRSRRWSLASTPSCTLSTGSSCRASSRSAHARRGACLLIGCRSPPSSHPPHSALSSTTPLRLPPNPAHNLAGRLRLLVEAHQGGLRRLPEPQQGPGALGAHRQGRGRRRRHEQGARLVSVRACEGRARTSPSNGAMGQRGWGGGGWG